MASLFGLLAVTTMDDGEYLDVPAFLRRSTEGDELTEELVNYGVDISTLTALIKKGLLRPFINHRKRIPLN